MVVATTRHVSSVPTAGIINAVALKAKIKANVRAMEDNFCHRDDFEIEFLPRKPLEGRPFTVDNAARVGQTLICFQWMLGLDVCGTLGLVRHLVVSMDAFLMKRYTYIIFCLNISAHVLFLEYISGIF